MSRPRQLSWPERHPFDESRIDDRPRWVAAVGRFLGLVPQLCRKYRREFPAAKYAVAAPGGLRERLRLLQDFGGLPQSVASLNSVPAEVLEGAVGAFAEHFGLSEEAATGNLAGTGNVPTEPDPAPRTRRTTSMEAPW